MAGMIKHEMFTEKLKEACLLLNVNIKKEAGDLIFDRISGRYVNKDFELAIDSLIEKGDKLSYPILKKQLDRFKEVRMDTERQQEKAKIARETQRALHVRVPIMEMVAAVTNKDPVGLKKYGLDRPTLKSNTVVIGADGRHREMYIDYAQPGFDDAVTTTKEQDGENIIARAYIMLASVKHQEIDNVHTEQKTGWANAKKVDDLFAAREFIPEIEEDAGWEQG